MGGSVGTRTAVRVFMRRSPIVPSERVWSRRWAWRFEGRKVVEKFEEKKGLSFAGGRFEKTTGHEIVKVDEVSSYPEGSVVKLATGSTYGVFTVKKPS